MASIGLEKLWPDYYNDDIVDDLVSNELLIKIYLMIISVLISCY